MARLSLALLGSPRVQLAGRNVSFPTKKALALLAYLAASPGRATPREKLADLLWGDTPEKQARNSLRQTLFSIRRALGSSASCLLVDGESLALDPNGIELDVAQFDRLVGEAAPPSLERAIELYRGEFLEGLSLKESVFDEWLAGERERLLAQALAALERLLRYHTDAGALAPAVPTALKILALDPLQEGVHRALMHFYAAQGRHGAALRQYQVCLGVLRRELGIEPGTATKQLYHDILQRRPTRMPTAEPATLRDTRWPGLGAAAARPVVEEPPLIGRRVELARLGEFFDEIWTGQGRVIGVLGEAGIGKTRLVEAASVEFLRRGGRALNGRAYEAEQVLPFRPWVDAFRSGHVIGADAVSGLKRVWRAELGRLFPEWTDATAGAPAVEDSLRLYEAVAQLTGHLAHQRPLLLVLEDMHWADEASLRLLSFLAHHIAPWPVAIVVTTREEEIAGNPVLGTVLRDLGHEKLLAQVALSPLSRRDTAALVSSLARTGSGATELARITDQAWDASRGHPFMVVEIMRALEQGTVPRTTAALPLPERVREVIAGRLGRLGERSRQLAGVAAVIGRPFDFRLLPRAAGLGEMETAEGVEELVRRRILHNVDDAITFVHDRTREVAYEQLLPPVRRLLHGLVARALEELHADNLTPHTAALGVHYLESEAWGPALGYLRQAATAAYYRGTHREAAACLEQALIAVHRLPESEENIRQAIDLRFSLRHALLPLWDARRILEILRQAETLAEAIEDEGRVGRVFAYFAHYHWGLAEYDRGLELAGRATEIGERLGDHTLWLGARFYVAQIQHALGNVRQSADLLGQIVASVHPGLVDERFNMAGFGRVLAASHWALSLAELGDFEAGIACGHAAVRDALRFGQPFGLTHAYVGLGLVCLRQGQVDEAISILERTRDLSRVGNLLNVYPMAEWFLGYAYTLNGRPAEALPLLEPLLTIDRLIGQPLWLSWLAETLAALGRRDDARVVVEDAVRMGRERNEHGHTGWALRVLGDILTDLGTGPGAAEAAYREALTIATDLDLRPLQAHARFGLGRLYQSLGKPDARGELSAAVDLFRAMDMTFWLPAAESALALVPA